MNIFEHYALIYYTILIGIFSRKIVQYNQTFEGSTNKETLLLLHYD